MSRLVPKGVAEREKHGFSSPYESWLRESLGEEVERRYAPGSAISGLVDPKAVAGLVAAHRSRSADQKNTLYCLLEFSEWHRAFVEGAMPAEALT